MSTPISAESLATLFLDARSYNAFEPKIFGDDEIEAIYNITKLGPTAGNSSPARFYWIVSKPAKDRLIPHLWEANRDKTYAAPATVVIGFDLDFTDHMGKLLPMFPLEVSKGFFDGPGVIQTAALRNASLQGAYLMLAARALGWDTGPMSGFDHAGVDAEFFAGTNIKSNFIVNIGKGLPEGLFGPRLPRFDFAEACKIL